MHPGVSVSAHSVPVSVGQLGGSVGGHVFVGAPPLTNEVSRSVKIFSEFFLIVNFILASSPSMDFPWKIIDSAGRAHKLSRLPDFVKWQPFPMELEGKKMLRR